MRPLRAVVVGAGVMGARHLRTLEELDGVQPVLVVDPALPRGLGVPVAAELDEAPLEAELAVLAAPSALHERLGLRLARAGLPTLVEKPVATSAAGARRLERCFAERGLPAAAGHVERFNPAIAALHRAVREGAIGRVREVRTERLGPFPDREMPVGVVADVLIHDIDLVLWCLGGRYEPLHAVVRTRPGRPCEDETVVEAELVRPSGDRVRLRQRASRLAPCRERRVLVAGSLGRLEADLLEQRASLLPASGGSHELPVRAAQPLAGELAAWRDAVRRGACRSPLASLAEGRAALEAAERILAAARTEEAIVNREAKA